MIKCNIETLKNSKISVASFTEDGKGVGILHFDAARLKTGPKVRFREPLYQEAFDTASNL